MKGRKYTGFIICLSLLLGAGFLSPCHGADFAAKKGLAFYEQDLTHLTKQTLALPPSEKQQKEILDHLFQMKFSEAERLFEFCSDSGEAKRQVAELYLLKAIENREAGNWVQAHAALEDAEAWSQDARNRNLQIGETQIDMAYFSRELEERIREKGSKVTFLIMKFPEDKMFHPDKVVLEQYDATKSKKTDAIELEDTPYQYTTAQWKPLVKPTKDDEEFILSKFRKALYRYFYEPSRDNAEFTLYLPRGGYRLFEKDSSFKQEKFTVTSKKIKVTLQPSPWFALNFSDEVHPANISLSIKGKKWEDLDHVPFGRYRIHVDHSDFAYSVARVNFIQESDEKGMKKKAKASDPGAYVVVEDRGSCTLALQPRSKGQKLRYALKGY